MIVPRTVDQQIIKSLKKWDLSGCGNAHSFTRGGGIQIKAGCSKAAQLSSRHGGQGWTELSLVWVGSLNILFREKVEEGLELQAGQEFPHGR